MKSSRVYASLIAIALLLTGCNENSSSSDKSTDTSLTDSSSQVVDTSSATDDSSEADKPFNPDEPDFSSFATLVEDGVWKFNDDVIANLEDISSVENNRFAFVSKDVENSEGLGHIHLVDLEKSEIKSCEFKANSSEAHYNIFLSDGIIILFDDSSAVIDIYAEDSLSHLSQIKLPHDVFFAQCDMYRNTLFVFISDNCAVYSYTIEKDGSYTSAEYSLESDYLLSFAGALSGNKLVFASDDGEAPTGSLIYDTETDSFSEFCDATLMTATTDNVIASDPQKGTFTIYDENAEAVAEGKYPISAGMLDTTDCGDIYFSNQTTDTTIDILRYDVDTGELISNITFEASEYQHMIYSITDSEDFTLLTFTPDYEKVDFSLYICRTKSPATIDTESFVYAENIAADTQKIIDEIKQEFGIEVFVNTPLYEDGSSGYYLTPDENDLSNYYTVSSFKNFLKLFPDGFFKELIEIGELEGIQVYFFETISSAGGGNTIPDAGGLCFTTDNPLKIALCTSMSPHSDYKAYAHEFMHAIEAISYESAFENGSDYLSIPFYFWHALNPSDFEYYCIYSDYGAIADGEYAKYFPLYAESDEDIAFFELYAGVFQMEDIAKTFEYMFNVGEGDMADYYYNSEYLQMKAAYICRCLRNTFECIGDDDIMPWEYNVDLEKYTFEYLENFATENNPDFFLAA